MSNIPIIKATNHLSHCIHLTNMLQKLVAQALTLGRPFYQTGNIHKPKSRRRSFLGVIHFVQNLQTLVRHLHNTYIWLNGTKRVIGRFSPRLGDCIK